MKKLNLREGIAVVAGLALLAYLLFAGPLVSFFNSSQESINISNMIQSGFTVEDTVVGSGDLAESGDMITAHYVGRLENGQVFDSSRDRGTPITFPLGQGAVIRGWDEGLVGMRVGGTRIITIAPDYGYGDRPVGAIPANSVLIFEVELLEAKQP